MCFLQGKFCNRNFLKRKLVWTACVCVFLPSCSSINGVSRQLKEIHMFNNLEPKQKKQDQIPTLQGRNINNNHEYKSQYEHPNISFWKVSFLWCQLFLVFWGIVAVTTRKILICSIHISSWQLQWHQQTKPKKLHIMFDLGKNSFLLSRWHHKIHHE